MNQKETNELLNKKRKRDEIIKNFFDLEEIFKTERAQNIFNSLGIFSLEEYSKFFQNLSNKEYKSMNEYHKKSKEPILIDKSKIKLDYTSKINEIQITIKDILKSNLQPKGISKKIKENMNKIIPKENNINFDLYLNSVSENIKNLLNTRSELDINIFKKTIKIYSVLIRSYDKIQFEQDNIFYKLLQKYLNKSISDFYMLSSFWLNNEYLLCSEKKESEINKYKRYDIILENIVGMVNNLLENSPLSIINNVCDFDKFISNVPLYNKAFIIFVTKFQKIYLDNKSDSINESLKKDKKKDLYNEIPFLENIKHIHISITNQKNLVEIKDKEEMRKILLENYLLLTRHKKYFNAKALEFIFNEVYNMGKFEQNIIKDFGNQGFDEIKNLNGEEDKDKIEQRFFFYLFLCKKDNSNIIKLPSVYKEVNQTIKDMMNPYVEKRFKELLKQNEQYFAEKLINECSENSEEIVLLVIKNIYGNPDYKCEKTIEDEKLYRNIKSFYMKYCPNLTKGVIEISNKIPLKDFFTKYNFVLDKIKQYETDQKPELINEIFEQINSKELNKNILENNYENIENITNKILFYILYYYQNVRNEEYKYYKNLMIKFHSKKLINLKNESFGNFNYEINILSNQLKKENRITLLEIFDIYDNYKENLNNLNEVANENIDFIINEFNIILINYINEKIKEGNNNKFLEEYYKKLTPENKKIFKSKIMKNISEQAKGNLDLILFGDM
jgi:hypothetical protein